MLPLSRGLPTEVFMCLHASWHLSVTVKSHLCSESLCGLRFFVCPLCINVACVGVLSRYLCPSV